MTPRPIEVRGDSREFTPGRLLAFRGVTLSALLSSSSLTPPLLLLTSGVKGLAPPSSSGAALTTSLTLSSLSTAAETSFAALACLRLRELGPARRLLGIASCSMSASVASAGTGAVKLLPAANRGSLVHCGTLASRFELTRNPSVSTGPFPDFRDTPAAPLASTPTNVGFTIVFFRGVAAMVLFT
jgi:hypothetical protein